MRFRNLTYADRADHARIAARFAHSLFHGEGTEEFVRNGVIPMTEDMLRELLEEVVALGFDCAKALAREGKL